MCKFEAIGVARQEECRTMYEAQKTFEQSCRICSSHGMRIDCDRCAIKFTHDLVCVAMSCSSDPVIRGEQNPHYMPRYKGRKAS